MLIIVDGPDGAGKTTLAKTIQQLAEARGSETAYFHNDKPPGNLNAPAQRLYMLKQYRAQYQAAAHEPWRTTIIDRAHYSEFVYGHLYRAQPDWNRSWDETALLQAWHPGHPIISVFITADIHTILDRADGKATFQQADNADRLIHERIPATTHERIDRERALFNLAYRRTVFPALQIDSGLRYDTKTMAMSILQRTIGPIKNEAWS